MGNTQMLAIWGGPGVGKTVTAVKLAMELATHKKNVIILMCDFVVPAPQTLLPNVSTEGKSLGELLTLPAISQEAILSRCIPFGKSDYISLLGHQRGDNAFSYAQYSKERAVDLITLLRHLADYVLIDVSGIFPFDTLSAVALENADAVLRLCACDLKSMSYFSSSLPLLADGRFALGRHIRALSMVKPGQDSGEYDNAFGGAAYRLPYVPELEEQFYAARLCDELCTKAAKKYNSALCAIVETVLMGGGATKKMREAAPAHEKTSKKEKPPSAIKPPRPTRREAEKDTGGIFDKLRKGGKP